MSPQTTARRRRALKAMSRELTGSLGRDRSRVVYRFDDGWTIRKLTRLEDQLREGHLAANCLRDLSEPDPNCHSLRDPDNLPHASFAAWRVDAGPAAARRLRAQGFFPYESDLIVTRRALFIADGRAGSQLKPVYAARLRSFGMSDATGQLEPLPAERDHLVWAFGLAIDPGRVIFGLHQ